MKPEAKSPLKPGIASAANPQLIREIPTLSTERLILRASRQDDFAGMCALWSHPEVIRYITGTPSTPDVTWARLLRRAGHWQMLGWGGWTVELRASGEFVGEVGFGDYKRDITPALGSRPEAGWLLLPQFHGQGLGTEAVLAAHIWADAHFNQPTVCLIDPPNHASIRLAKRAGYRGTVETEFNGEPCLIMERPCR
jgi:RimJ/RimL family protein N-acetyltransferase